MRIIDYKTNIESYPTLFEYFLVEHGVNFECYTVVECKAVGNKQVEIVLDRATLEDVIEEKTKEKEQIKARVCKKYNLSEEEYSAYEEEYKKLNDEFFYYDKKHYKEFIHRNFVNSSIMDFKKFRYFQDLDLENYIKAIKDSTFNIKVIKNEESTI